MAATTVTVNSAVIIEEAGLGRPLCDAADNLESGYTPVEFDLLMEKDSVEITTQTVAALSAFALTGMSDANTLDGVLYGKIDGITYSVVHLYKDAARSAEVATGDNITRTVGGSVTLTAANASGLSGTCIVIPDAVNAATLVLTARKEYSRYDRDNLTGQSVVGIVSFYDSELFQIECYSNPVKALIDGIGCDNVDGIYERDAMKKAALLKNITLV